MTTPPRQLDGRVAIVTGAASGIGLATARRLGHDGARIVVADLDASRAAAAARTAEAAGAPEALGLACDVSREPDVEAVVARANERWGRLDVVVNCAGLMVFKPLVEHTEEDWLHVLRVDLLGAFFFTRQALLHMHPERGGAIVNVASVHARQTTPLVASYAAAKAALLSLTRSTAIEAKARHIRCNAVLPGAVDTPMLWANPNLASGVEAVDPADVGQPDDIAAAVAFLASDEARFTTGATLVVDGGRLARL